MAIDGRHGRAPARTRVHGPQLRTVPRRQRRAENLRRAKAGSGTIRCECGDGACIERLPLDASQYRRVRVRWHEDGYFLVLRGHERRGLERIAGEADLFLVVDAHG